MLKLNVIKTKVNSFIEFFIFMHFLFINPLISLADQYKVIKVIDGDTIVLDNNESNEYEYIDRDYIE
jgi:hypothetical protein